jgi:hypothetical protein
MKPAAFENRLKTILLNLNFKISYVRQQRLNMRHFKYFFLRCALSCLMACARYGDPSDYVDIALEDAGPENLPKSVDISEEGLYPKIDYEIVASRNGQEAMLMQIGTGKGDIMSDCRCADPLRQCPTQTDIFACSRDSCSNCKMVLRIYRKPILVNRAEW